MKNPKPVRNSTSLRSGRFSELTAYHEIKIISLTSGGRGGYKRNPSSHEDQNADDNQPDNHHDDARHHDYKWWDGDKLAGGGLWTKRSGNLISSAKRSQTNPHQNEHLVRVLFCAEARAH